MPLLLHLSAPHSTEDALCPISIRTVTLPKRMLWPKLSAWVLASPISIPGDMNIFHWGFEDVHWGGPQTLQKTENHCSLFKIQHHLYIIDDGEKMVEESRKPPLILELGHSGPITADPMPMWPKFFNPARLHILICKGSMKVLPCRLSEVMGTIKVCSLQNPDQAGTEQALYTTPIPGSSLHDSCPSDFYL